MAILKQSSNAQLIYQGWYGLCDGGDDNCNTFPLVSGSGFSSTYVHDSIKYIFEVSDNSEGSIMYDGSLTFGGAIATLPIKELKCGRCYQIIMKKGSEQLEIPQFTHSNFSTIEKKKITDSCAVVETPTPVPQQTPTPTPVQPTPTPTPFDCCSDTDFSFEIVNGKSGGDNNVTCLSQGTTTSDGTWDGTFCWEELTEDHVLTTYPIELRESSTSSTSLGKLQLRITSKYQGQKFYFTLKSNGICYTGEMRNTDQLEQFAYNIWTPASE